MASLESICRTVRTRLGLPPTGAPVDPDWLLTMLDELEADPRPFCDHDGLFGTKVRWNECAPKSTQKHQIGRACSAYLLRGMRQLQHSPGLLSEMLCGTSPVDTQVEDIRRELYELRNMRVHARVALGRANSIVECFPIASHPPDAGAVLWAAAAKWVHKLTVAVPEQPQPREVLLVRPRRHHRR